MVICVCDRSVFRLCVGKCVSWSISLVISSGVLAVLQSSWMSPSRVMALR